MLDKFIQGGSIDSYNPIIEHFPDLLLGVGVDALMWVGILFLLYFNKYTRNFTIGSAILFVIFGG